MTKLSAHKRKNLEGSQFAGPNRTYPIPDRVHAGNAKARAAEAVKAGRMSKNEQSKIDAKANKVLKRGKQ